MAKEKNAPAIRFKGFTDDWEHCEIGDAGFFYYGRSCPKWSVTENATIPCIRYGELYTKFGSKIDTVYSHTSISTEHLRFSKGTEVLIPRVGEDPMDYNHCTWLSIPNIAIGEMISVYNTHHNPLFTATMFNATLQVEFAMRVEGGSVTNLYFEKLKNIQVAFPDKEEQMKIAELFTRIDSLIILHQHKLDKLQNVKKSMLAKMFPKDENKVPEIRFKGFTDDWEKLQLSDIADIVGGGTPSTTIPEYWDGDIDWYSPSEIGDKVYANGSEKKITELGYHKSSANMLPADITVLFTSRASIGDMAILRRSGTTNQGFQSLVLKSADTYFVYSMGHLIKSYAEVNASGSTFLEISGKALGKMPIRLPAHNEQEKIGIWFKAFDQIITLQQRKLEKLKNIKKSMLEKMFVQQNFRKEVI